MKFSWRDFDPTIVTCALLLIVVGLVVVYSATMQDGYSAELIRQAQMIAVGVVLFVLCTFVDSRFWFRNSPWFYVLLLALLVSVLFFGQVVKGAQRWITLGPLGQFQPSELAKLLMVLSLASFLSGPGGGAYGDYGCSVRKYVVSLGLVGLPMLLVMLQPDLGTAIATGFIGLSMVYVSGVSWKLLFGTVATALAVLPLGLHDYQWRRISVFLNPEADPAGSGWNIIQAKVAIGCGGLFGKGITLGSQNRLNFVPEHHTDFAFTVIGEEMGFIGCVCVVIVLGCIVARALQIAQRAPTPFESYVAAGVGAFFAIHTIVNVGMTCGVLPVVGIPLPFVSYGGTAAVTNCVALGILNHISCRCGTDCQLTTEAGEIASVGEYKQRE